MSEIELRPELDPNLEKYTGPDAPQPEEGKRPEVIVYAGPNGSGKTTITKYAKVIDPYINADDIKKILNIDAMEAALTAEKMREEALSRNIGFTFETVLSTERNLNLLRRAKEAGYFVRCIYVLTADPEINVMRVASRAQSGGHDVPEDKIRSRYEKSLAQIPQLIETCDVIHVYDNTDTPFRIFKKRKEEYFFWESPDWTMEEIEELTGVKA
ncbi:MAG: zeta toxin family protein [Firmicutes bacterium]|nr:zeta toxin family protein [Bacillota bacterium]